MELRFSTLGLDDAGEIDIVGGRLTLWHMDGYRAAHEEQASQWPDAAPGLIDMRATTRFVDAGGLV